MKFIPVLEETGLISGVSEWVLCVACKQVKRWMGRGFGPLQVAVNLSARQFREENLSETIDRCLWEASLDSQCLGLELTESLVMDGERGAAARVWAAEPVEPLPEVRVETMIQFVPFH